MRRQIQLVIEFRVSYREAVVAAQAPPDAGGELVKVLHVIGSVDPRGGGPVEGVLSSSEVWLHHGHQRHIVSLDPPCAPWVATARAPTRAVGLDGAFYRLARAWIPWLRYGYAPRLVGWLRDNAAQ